MLSLLAIGCGPAPAKSSPRNSSGDMAVRSAWVGGIVGVWTPPDGSAPKASIILHQGHNSFSSIYPNTGGDYDQDLRPAAEAFATAGYVVYGVEMPVGPHTNTTLAEFKAATLHLLDNIIDHRKPVYMVGLSGGGWTTTLMTVTDARIAKGYSVSGDAPIELYKRPEPWPATDPEHLYYDSLTFSQQAGSRLLHIYNYYEPCCLYGISGDIGYAYATDYTAFSHRISPWAVNYIIQDLATLQ